MSEGIHDRLFLIRRAIRHSSFSRVCIVILPFPDTGFVLDLCNIKIGYVEPVLLFNPTLDIRVGGGFRLALQLLNIQINVDMSVNLFPS